MRSSKRATLDKDPRDVAAMFDQVAARYDVTNLAFTGGMERLWRRLTVQALRVEPGDRILDVAAGTAVSTVSLQRAGATAVGVDFSLGMLRAAKQPLPLVAGDALRLPFADEAFDAVTISFGLRNVVDTGAALTELARVTRPGGRLVVCETSRPAKGIPRAGHALWVTRGVPLLGRLFSSDSPAYAYLAESALAWPSPEDLSRVIALHGWTRVQWRPLSLGAVALHRAQKH
jgi:demethylmenaquinone methyltransferase/2-methoxy-6-polyprenyl-1,4-benzoquinol methylase